MKEIEVNDFNNFCTFYIIYKFNILTLILKEQLKNLKYDVNYNLSFITKKGNFMINYIFPLMKLKNDSI